MNNKPFGDLMTTLGLINEQKFNNLEEFIHKNQLKVIAEKIIC